MRDTGHAAFTFRTDFDKRPVVPCISIGTTAPADPLHIVSTTGTVPQAKLESSANDTMLGLRNTSTGGREWWLGSGGNGAGGGPNFYIYDATAPGVRMAINSAGYVGIGTTAPATALHISRSNTTGAGVIALVENTATTGSPYAIFQMKAANSQYGQFFGGAALNNYGIVTGITMSPGSSSQDIGFRVGSAVDGTGNGPALIIKSTGCVGIGTTAPTAKLEVAGTVKATSLNTTFSGCYWTGWTCGSAECPNNYIVNGIQVGYINVCAGNGPNYQVKCCSL